MRSFFPFLALTLAAVIPACTCAKTETTEATPASSATTDSSTRVSSVVRPTQLRLPSRVQINPAGLKPLRLPAGVGTAAGAPTGAASAP